MKSKEMKWRTYWHRQAQETCVDTRLFAASSEDNEQLSASIHCSVKRTTYQNNNADNNYLFKRL